MSVTWKKIFRRIRRRRGLVQVREYGSYDDYVKHQMEKTLDPVRREKWLGEEWDLKIDFFRGVFERHGALIRSAPGRQALGLGARTGQEVQAMLDSGLDAVGVDLVPCEPLVVEGDIHDLPFPEESFDFVFSNIFDHALKPRVFMREAQRVLRPGGLFLLHLSVDRATDAYGVTEVGRVDDVVALTPGWSIEINEPMESWGGGLNHELVLRKQNDR